MSVGQERLDFLHEHLEHLRDQTDAPEVRSQIGVIESRYHRVLNGVEKVLIDHANEIRADAPWPEIVLWAMDILGMDTDAEGWAPHAERAQRMGW